MAKVQSQISADTNDGSALTVATQTFGASFTAGNCVWGHVSWAAGAGVTVSSVSDGTNTYTIDQATGPDANGIYCTTFHKENVAAVTTPIITATLSSAGSFRRIRGEERSGIVTTGALNKKAAQAQAAPGTGTDAVTSSAQTTTVDGCQVVAVGYDDSSATIPAAGTGYASVDTATFAAGDAFRVEDQTQGTQGSIAGTFTTTAGTDLFHTHMLAFASATGQDKGTIMRQTNHRPRPFAPGNAR